MLCTNKNNSANIEITHKGTLCIKDIQGRNYKFRKVLYSKDISENLLQTKMPEKSCTVLKNACKKLQFNHSINVARQCINFPFFRPHVIILHVFISFNFLTINSTVQNLFTSSNSLAVNFHS